MQLNNKQSSYVLIISILFASLCHSTILQAATLGQRAIYNVNIVVETDPTSVGDCSSFAFGDASTTCGTGGAGPLEDNTDTDPALPLSGGDGVAGDGFAGVITIETGRADGVGDNTFTLINYQLDPYLNTPGGTFKTSMTPPDGANNGSGTITAAGSMVLDVDGRVGVAATFVGSLGIQPWNIDDSTSVNVPTTGVYQTFTTGTSVNYLPGAGGAPPPNEVIDVSLTGRQIGDENTDSILDAILVSAGNIGQSWGFFDGVTYTEIYNVQFVLVSAKPVAVDDLLVGNPVTPLLITVSTDLLGNDLDADPAETISLDSFTQPTGSGSSVVDNLNGTLTYNPPALGATTDTFTYTITDTVGELDTATVTINLAIGDPPDCNNVIASTNEDTQLTVDPTTGCSDPDGDPITVLAFDPVSAQLGAVAAGAGNDLVYTPPSNFFSPPDDSFNFTVTDGNGGVAGAAVIITVNPINDPLVCADVENNTDIDTPLAIDVANELLITCTDTELDPIIFVTAQTPTDQGGSVSFDGANTLTYTPATGFEGTDTYTYTASDGTDTDTRTITTKVGIDFGNFTMLNVPGNTFGGTNDVVFTWDNTINDDEVDYTNNLNFNMTIKSESSFPFNGFPWFAHTIRVFGEGTYSFDTGCTVAEIQATGCPAGSAANSDATLTMTIGPGQLGVHILFDWNTSTNIDVVNVWNQNDVWDTHGDVAPKNELWTGAAGPSPDPTTTWALVSTDANGDGINGSPMVDGPFQGFYANFNRSPGATAEAQPPYTGTAPDTKLGGSLFASPMNPWVLFAVFMTLVGARRYGNNLN